MKAIKSPTPEQRRELLLIANEKERLVREDERFQITTISRTQAWKLEQEGKHPLRRKIGAGSVAWLLSDLLFFINTQCQ